MRPDTLSARPVITEIWSIVVGETLAESGDPLAQPESQRVRVQIDRRRAWLTAAGDSNRHRFTAMATAADGDVGPGYVRP
jgi:hypothetical protein